MNLKKETKFFLIKHFLTFFAHYIFKLYAKTMRLRIENEDVIKNHLENDGRVVLAAWHQRLFAAFYIPRRLKMPISIMISQSRDGDFAANIAKRLGGIPVRGSSSRGGRKALREMINAIIKNQIAGHIVDGPTGPPHVIKAGLISLAQRSGAAICPCYAFYENAWIFNSWDRFMVPKPFSRIVIRFGALEFIPENIDGEEFERIRIHIEQKMVAEYGRGDRSVTFSRSSI
ncbi:MAG: lysophospholipid acyltransferase family protein [Thermodesulfobacteriota bacterium]|nr:lysophospholipid acyltransferase family protein [Thermodesulfobacteriota bacterium]